MKRECRWSREGQDECELVNMSISELEGSARYEVPPFTISQKYSCLTSNQKPATSNGCLPKTYNLYWLFSATSNVCSTGNQQRPFQPVKVSPCISCINLRESPRPGCYNLQRLFYSATSNVLQNHQATTPDIAVIHPSYYFKAAIVI